MNVIGQLQSPSCMKAVTTMMGLSEGSVQVRGGQRRLWALGLLHETSTRPKESLLRPTLPCEALPGNTQD